MSVVDRLRRFLQNLPGWSPAERGLVPLVMGLPLYLQIIFWQQYVLRRPDRVRLVNVAVVERDSLLVAAMVAGTCILIGVGLWLRRHHPRSMVFQYFTVQYYALTMAYYGYEIGTQSFINGVVMLSAPMVGLIIMDRRAVLCGFVTGAGVVVSCAFASALGRLPYAPVVLPPSDHDGAMFWLVSYYYFAWTHIIFIIVLTDLLLASWRQRERQVRLLSRTDVLTGTHNRRHILELLERELARSRRLGSALTVVMLDLDNFKHINDRFGHATGDRVLQAVARLLLANVRGHDAIGRYGGEEFLLLLADTGLDGATTLIERCRRQLEAASVDSDNGTGVGISGSFGLACTEQFPGHNSAQLLKAADQALYRAKAGGRNRVEAEVD